VRFPLTVPLPAEELPSLLDVLQRGNVSQPCQEGAMDLMGCYSDGSLAVKTGCCSKDCAQSIDKVRLCVCVWAGLC
jgi:hypothetical protein